MGLWRDGWDGVEGGLEELGRGWVGWLWWQEGGGGGEVGSESILEVCWNCARGCACSSGVDHGVC